MHLAHRLAQEIRWPLGSGPIIVQPGALDRTYLPLHGPSRRLDQDPLFRPRRPGHLVQTARGGDFPDASAGHRGWYRTLAGATGHGPVRDRPEDGAEGEAIPPHRQRPDRPVKASRMDLHDMKYQVQIMSRASRLTSLTIRRKTGGCSRICSAGTTSCSGSPRPPGLASTSSSYCSTGLRPNTADCGRNRPNSPRPLRYCPAISSVGGSNASSTIRAKAISSTSPRSSPGPSRPGRRRGSPATRGHTPATEDSPGSSRSHPHRARSARNEKDLLLLLRAHSMHRRRCVPRARVNPGAAAGHRPHPAQVRLPDLSRRCGQPAGPAQACFWGSPGPAWLPSSAANLPII